MFAYIVRRILYNIPVFLGVVLVVMAALRVHDPVGAYLGKNATQEDYEELTKRWELDRPFLEQYGKFLWRFVRLPISDEETSWDQPGLPVSQMIRQSIGPTLALTVPALAITTFLSVCVGMVSAYYRGRLPDRVLVMLAVLGMSISLLVYIILGQYFGAFKLKELLGTQIFAIEGYEWGLRHWPHYCLLPVMISVIVAMGYDTRFYRAVMVEESNRDYITTARAKGATQRKIMFVHMLKNAMIPIITRVMITVPFLITGSIVMEMYFGIPGMGRTLITAVTAKDFPVIQTFTAVFAGIFIVTNILTDVLYALVDPRVRLS